MDVVALSEYLNYYFHVIDIPFYCVKLLLWGSLLTGFPAQVYTFKPIFSSSGFDFAILFYVYTWTYTEQSLLLNLKYRQWSLLLHFFFTA